MEKFLKGTKRKSSAIQEDTGHPAPYGDDSESTDVKLTLLASLYPDVSQEALLETLLAHDGSVDAASSSLADGQAPASPKKTSLSKGAIGIQTSLRLFASPSTSGGGRHSSASSTSPKKKPRLLSKKGTTLHLYDPVDVEEHTPCSIIHNFLPREQADALLRELLEESRTFEKISFKLFDNVVSSPHTSSFYVETQAELDTQKHDYYYNGGKLTDVRRITPQLLRARPRVQEAVNAEIRRRVRERYPGGQKLRFQSPERWAPNAAFVNCYDGPRESVGYHSDQLTYLGPRPVIGSLSLGVAREFRVRRIVPRGGAEEGEDNGGGDAADDGKSEPEPEPDAGDAGGQIAIHLPHNSLLVMHAEMQEEWKHSVAAARAVDPHPIAGQRRINVTYRDYRASFHPRHTARCRCGVPAVLRVARPRLRRRGPGRGGGSRYFWMCYAGRAPAATSSCDFFEWADFDDDGNPSWDRERYRKPRLESVGADILA